VLTWQGEEYLGIGLGACSHITGRRWGNTDDFEQYCESSGEPDSIVAYSEKLRAEEKARECAVFWLRLFDGISLPEFREKTGFDFLELYRDVLPPLVADGFITIEAEKIRVEKQFHPVLDSVLEYFI
jgi:oxygen-independent coproporphyrinogen-3 oxidase